MSARCRLALLLAACWSTAQAAADQHDGSAPSERRVGFSPLTGELAAEHRYLAETLPWLLRERLAGIDGVELVDADAPVGVLPRQVAAARDIDLLIWGTIDSAADHLVAGHLVLELRAFDAASVRTVWSYYEAGQADALQGAIDAAADGLAPLLLGQPWSRLAVEPVPADSTVRLDGVLVGVGTTLLRYTAPRRATLTVSRPGYHRSVRQVELAPGQELRVAVELLPRDLGIVLLDSQPTGAAVYVASVHAGVTPLRLPRPPTDAAVSLVLEGYADTTARIGPAAPETLTVPLLPAGFDGAAEQASGRERLYEELGWFAVSLLPPLLLSALVTDFAARDAALHDGAPIAWQPATIGVTVGAVAAAGYSVYRLVRTIGVMIEYTETADRPAG